MSSPCFFSFSFSFLFSRSFLTICGFSRMNLMSSIIKEFAEMYKKVAEKQRYKYKYFQKCNKQKRMCTCNECKGITTGPNNMSLCGNCRRKKQKTEWGLPAGKS